MAFDKVVDSTKLFAGMTATANAIREKTGSTDPIVWDASNGFKSAVEGIEAGGGGGSAEVYYSDIGQLYTPHMVIPENAQMRYNRDHFQNAIHLVSFIQKSKCGNLDSDYGLFSGCVNLEEVWVTKPTFGNYCFRDCSALRIITLGNVGIAVTKLGSLYHGATSKIEQITCYVSANTIAEISTDVTSKILPASSPNATIIYRNSTTGEVITE